MSIIGIIPARYSSSRFPGKPLVEINGKTMLQRVYEQTKKANLLNDVIIATDDERIETHAKSFGANVIITNPNHQSGTDRCFEAYLLNNKPFDYVINIQGDEPFIDPIQIDSLAQFCNGETEIATQMIKCKSHDINLEIELIKKDMEINKKDIEINKLKSEITIKEKKNQNGIIVIIITDMLECMPIMLKH